MAENLAICLPLFHRSPNPVDVLVLASQVRASCEMSFKFVNNWAKIWPTQAPPANQERNQAQTRGPAQGAGGATGARRGWRLFLVLVVAYHIEKS